MPVVGPWPAFPRYPSTYTRGVPEGVNLPYLPGGRGHGDAHQVGRACVPRLHGARKAWSVFLQFPWLQDVIDLRGLFLINRGAGVCGVGGGGLPGDSTRPLLSR